MRFNGLDTQVEVSLDSSVAHSPPSDTSTPPSSGASPDSPYAPGSADPAFAPAYNTSFEGMGLATWLLPTTRACGTIKPAETGVTEGEW